MSFFLHEQQYCTQQQPMHAALCVSLKQFHSVIGGKERTRKHTVKSISQLCFISCRANTLLHRHKS